MASNDPPTVTAVEHTEGTSYVVAFGDPARYPLPNSENYFCDRFPAAGGENPYQPEMGNMAQCVAQLMPEDASAAPNATMTMALMMQMGNALCVSMYDALRCVPEESRGLSFKFLMNQNQIESATNWFVDYSQRAGPQSGIGSLAVCLFVCFYRMCHRDGTLQICTETPDKATRSAPDNFDMGAFYFNLSPRERTRLREYANGIRRDRRMPTILARQLIISKVDKRKLHGQLRRLVYGLFMTESDELFRVVVSFL